MKLAEISVPFMKNEAVVLPTAPKAARSSEIDTSRVPKVPPFKIYMGNIPYDFDEDMIKDFFSPHEPISIEIPKGDKGSRGFGYVEFGDRESLIAALAKDGTSLGQRSVRISLPEESGRGRDGDRPRRDGGMGGMDGRDPGRTDNDWRREPRELPPVKADAFPGRDNSNRGMGFDRVSSGGFDRNRNGGFQPYQPGNQRMDPRPEPDFDNVRRQDPNFGPKSSNSSWERNQDTRPRFVPSVGGGPERSQDDGYQDRYQNDRRSDQGYQQHQMYNDPPRDYQRPPPRDHRNEESTEGVARDAPIERKRLQLQPRSRPKEEIAAPAEVIRSSIFGDAKPVDTAKKELEIEEKIKTIVPVTEPDLPSEDSARLRRTSTGSGKSGNRSRQTSESGSHHSPRETAPVVVRSGFHRQDSDKTQGDRRPPRILMNPDRGTANQRDDRSHQSYDRRDNYERRDYYERRDNYDRRDQNERRNNQRGGYNDRPMNRRDENVRYENNGRNHYDGQSNRGGRGHSDDHTRPGDRNSDRRDRQPRPDRPRTDMKTDKELVSWKFQCDHIFNVHPCRNIPWQISLMH